MNSDTPETDAHINQNKALVGHAVVCHDFARKLERERDEARKKTESAHTLIQYIASKVPEENGVVELGDAITAIVAERDQLRKVCDHFASSIIIQNILAEGRPHGSNRFSAPDGCECDDCQECDLLARAYNQLPHVKDKAK